MRKSIIFCLCVAVVAMFSACKDPEGVYNPSKKIQKIYTVDEDGVKELAETWNWNGDLLTSIVYDDNLYETKFVYDDKNRLVSMNDETSKNEFIYDGKFLEKIVTTVNGEVMGTTEFEHDGKKISVIKIDFDFSDPWDDDDWDKMGIINPLRFVMPELCPVVEAAAEKCAKDAKGEQITINLNWKGDNVSSMQANVVMYGMTISETIELTYDNKNNPLYGLFASASSDAAGNLFLNKNNPVTVKNLYMGQVLGTSDYTYEYDGNYPTKVTVKTVEDEYVDVNTIIYEY